MFQVKCTRTDSTPPIATVNITFREPFRLPGDGFAPSASHRRKGWKRRPSTNWSPVDVLPLFVSASGRLHHRNQSDESQYSIAYTPSDVGKSLKMSISYRQADLINHGAFAIAVGIRRRIAWSFYNIDSRGLVDESRVTRPGGRLGQHPQVSNCRRECQNVASEIHVFRRRGHFRISTFHQRVFNSRKVRAIGEWESFIDSQNIQCSRPAN